MKNMLKKKLKMESLLIQFIVMVATCPFCTVIFHERLHELLLILEHGLLKLPLVIHELLRECAVMVRSNLHIVLDIDLRDRTIGLVVWTKHPKKSYVFFFLVSTNRSYQRLVLWTFSKKVLVQRMKIIDIGILMLAFWVTLFFDW